MCIYHKRKSKIESSYGMSPKKIYLIFKSKQMNRYKKYGVLQRLPLPT